MPADLPVAAPDPAAEVRALLGPDVFSPTAIDPDGKRYSYDLQPARDRLLALLAERQQDKERIERLEAALREIASQASDRPDIDVCDDIEDYARAALAVEEDAHG